MIRIAAALAVAGLVVSGPAAMAQPKAKAGAQATYKAPRLTGTKLPDLNGVWQVMNSAGWDVEPHAARAALQMRPGPYIPVPAKDVLALGAVGAVPGGLGVVEGGEIPYTPDARKMRDENRANYLDRDPEVKCYLPGVPRANYMHLPFQIFQSEKSLMIAYEYAGAVRNVMFDDPGPAPVDSWMGQSVAKWDGDSLVITVTGQNDRTWFDRAGNHHSANMTVVERYTPTGPNTMRYEATITDPDTFTRPWKMSMNLYKRVGEDAQLNQFKCVEFVEELMYGHLRKEPLK
ncbi:hypothetical protein ACO2Q0_04775 [Phenylobacterium sp. VNQ135]|uniref:hypothetical protein n=1 Tax=Phenylobacterium sp. VNQ135 TaxID=3400922 RepID=UPI003BFBB662